LNLESQLFFNYKFSTKQIEIFIISIFGGLLLSFIFFKDFPLVGYTAKSLIISQATQDNVDIAKRVSLYYKLLFSASASTFFFYLAINKICTKLFINRKALQTSLVLSAIGLLLIFCNLIGLESNKTILFVTILNSISIAFVLIGNYYRRLRYLYNSIFFLTIAICSFLISAGILFVFNSSTNFLGNFQPVYFSIFFLCAVTTVFIKTIFGISFRKLFSLNIVLSSIPILLFLVTEFQFFYFSKFNTFIRYKFLFLALFLLIAIVCFFIGKRRRFLKSNYYILNKYLSPLSLLGFLVLTIYKPFIGFADDIFELANPANAILRTFQFKEIPLLDFMSSHMLSEQFFSWIYFFLFGYSHTLEFTTYFFLSDVLFVVLAFWFLKYIFNDGLLALLFLAFFPLVGMLFSDSIFISIIGFTALYRLNSNQKTVSYFMAFSIILILIVWRLDTGIAALFTTFVFLPILFYSNRTIINYKNLFKGLLYLSLLLVSFVLLATGIRDINFIKENFFSALHYISQNQAHGYSKIANEINTEFYFYHFFIPLISLCCIVFSTLILRLNNLSLSKERKYILTASIFLFLVCLSNFQRGLVRHSFYEGSEHFLVSTFFIAMSLFLLSFFRTEKSHIKFILLFHISFFILISLKYFGLDKGKTQMENFLTASSIKNIDTKFNEINYKGRIISEGNSFVKFGNLLNTNFASNQSFLDFSNTPMMYFFTQRKVPGYFCQPLQNSIDDYLQIQLLKNINTQNTPVVVYSNFPKNWFDETDGVPNSMRQYLVAEYIYKNYKPFSIIDKKSVWIDKNLTINFSDFLTDTVSTKIQIHNYKKAAKVINNYFENKGNKGLKLIGSSKSNFNKEFNFSYFYLPKNIDYSKGVFAKVFVYCNAESKFVKLISKKDYSFISEIIFEADNTAKSYMVRLSNHYLWHINNPDHIVVDCENGASIEKIEFYYDNRF